MRLLFDGQRVFPLLISPRVKDGHNQEVVVFPREDCDQFTSQHSMASGRQVEDVVRRKEE